MGDAWLRHSRYEKQGLSAECQWHCQAACGWQRSGCSTVQTGISSHEAEAKVSTPLPSRNTWPHDAESNTGPHPQRVVAVGSELRRGDVTSDQRYTARRRKMFLVRLPLRCWRDRSLSAPLVFWMVSACGWKAGQSKSHAASNHWLQRQLSTIQEAAA